MRTSPTIPQNPRYPHSMDWQFLRREGVRHIEQLTSDVWTDFNLHDPGITMLEVLCYAITDVGNRANMDSVDLFAQAEGKAFFSAAEMLPCNPVTALDYRKVLVNIPGVQNAWVEQLHDAEVRFEFRFDTTLKSVQDLLKPYLEKADAPGNLDDTFQTIVADIEGVILLIKEIHKCQSHKKKEEAKNTLYRELLAQIDIDALPAGLKRALLWLVGERYYAEWITRLTEVASEESLPGVKDTLLGIIVKLQATHNSASPDYVNIGMLLDQLATDFNLPELKALQDFVYKEPLLCLILTESLKIISLSDESTTDKAYNIFIPQGIYSVTLQLEPDRLEDEVDIKASALKAMHRFRNLDEDIHPEVHVIEYIDMGIQLTITIDPAHDALDVMANVYHSIRQYLSPVIRFYSLEEMMNRYAVFEVTEESIATLRESNLPGELIDMLQPLVKQKIVSLAAFRKELSVLWDETTIEDYYSDLFLAVEKKYDSDPVYNGPLLDHGFIDEEELLQSQPRQTVYRSDLYQVIAAVKGVTHVDRLEIFKCEDDVDKRLNNWCLAFECRCLPQLNLECSEFAISSHGVEVPLNTEKLREYTQAHPQSTSKLNRKGTLDLPIPQGRVVSDFTDYTSIQEDFPRTYKIGNTGISKKQTELRQAQAKQLKGYLIFYDQLLANYLTHLKSVKGMLSVQPAETVAYQPLFNIPFVREVLLDYPLDTNWENRSPDADKTYLGMLQKLSEGNETEKNIFHDILLDHLLARFGERFTDYAAQLYRIEKPLENTSDWDADAGLTESIKDKRRFLQQIPELSATRAQGFNYRFDRSQPLSYWKSTNVEGMKKRICAKLGIDDATRHTLTCEPGFIVEVGVKPSIGGGSAGRTRYEYYIRKDEQSTTRLLVSTAVFSSSQAAEKASADFLNMAVDKSGYGVIENQVGFWANVKETDRTLNNAMMLEPRADEDAPEKRLRYILDLVARDCEEDGFHLLEHILLRPRNDSYTNVLHPMLCCLQNLELIDPYSFWITVVIPDWSARFKNLKRREAFQQTVRRETPAHLMPRFCMLSREDMFRFEKLYNEWLRSLCSEKQDGLAQVTDELVALMNSWKEEQITLM